MQRNKESLLPVAIIFSIIFGMGKADKILEKMQNNPRDRRIGSLKTVARAKEYSRPFGPACQTGRGKHEYIGQYHAR